MKIIKTQTEIRYVIEYAGFYLVDSLGSTWTLDIDSAFMIVDKSQAESFCQKGTVKEIYIKREVYEP